MSALAAILAGAAVKVGAPIIKEILSDRFGRGGEIAGDVIDTIAAEAGVAPEKLPELPTPELEAAVLQAEEAHGPEWLALWTAGLDYQKAIALAEHQEAPIERGWRWGWMYLLGFFWTWAFVLVPLVNALSGAGIPSPASSDLLTLTGWFMALYMGGHTIKDLGKQAKEAWQARKNS